MGFDDFLARRLDSFDARFVSAIVIDGCLGIDDSDDSNDDVRQNKEEEDKYYR